MNFKTNCTIPHLHYVGLSRATNIEGLHTADLCEGKITVSPDVEKRNGTFTNWCKITIIYMSPIERGRNTVKILLFKCEVLA